MPKYCSFNSSMHCSFELSPERKVELSGVYNPFSNERQSHSFSYNSQPPRLPSTIKRVHSFSGELDRIHKLKPRPSLNQSIISNHSLEIPDPFPPPPARLSSATNVSSAIIPADSSSTLFPSYPNYSNSSLKNPS